jgi:hypothetical protein
MSVRVELVDGWQGKLHEAEFVFFDAQLGPDITDDARRYVPVDTRRLQASLDHTVVGGGQDGPVLQVGSFPDEEGPVEYAAAVELGFHGPEVVREHMRRSKNGVEHTVREHIRHANTPEQPYLRPALYQERYQ